jgi:drug/metabolite transporter (DMT)-like permease
MVQAAFWFAVMSLLVKLASRTLPTLQIVFVRGVVTLVLASASLAIARRSPFGGRTSLLLLRGTIGSCALVCYYLAVSRLSLAEAAVIHQTAPLWTALLAAWWLGERLTWRIGIALLVAFGGVVLIARPGWLFAAPATADPTAWQFAFLALLGAVLSAFAYVTVRRLGRTEDALVVVFWFPVVTVPLSAPFAVPVWIAPNGAEWLLLVGIGATTQIAQVAMTKGLAREAAGRATAVGYLQVAFATLFSALVFQVVPDALSWTGMAMIVASLLAATWRR